MFNIRYNDDDNNVSCPNCDESMPVGGTCDNCGYEDPANN